MSQSSIAGGSAGSGFDRVTIDGEEYLAHDVVAQREGVYTYPDPKGGIRRELVTADELTAAIEDVDEVSVIVSHPTTDDESKEVATMTTDPRANFAEVGTWRDLRPTDDEKGIAGQVLIRVDEIGRHNGELRQYVSQVKQFGIGEVSTGYNIQEAIPDTGRFNGMEYGYRQQGLGLDHLALLPNEQGDCSVEDGCGLGRANQHEETEVRVNHHVQGFDDASVIAADALAETSDDDLVRTVGKRFLSTFGLDRFIDGQTTPAESGRANDSSNMENKNKINELVEEHGFTRENIEPLAGTTCLNRIHEAVVEQESESNETPSGESDGDVSDGLTDSQREEIQAMVPTAEDIAKEVDIPAVEVENVDEDELIEQAADKAAERADQVRAHSKNVEKVAESESNPLTTEQLERMNEDVVADLADDLDDSESESDRVNFAGRPSGGSFDASDFQQSGESSEVAVAGSRRIGEGGDD